MMSDSIKLSQLRNFILDSPRTMGEFLVTLLFDFNHKSFFPHIH